MRDPEIQEIQGEMRTRKKLLRMVAEALCMCSTDMHAVGG